MPISLPHPPFYGGHRLKSLDTPALGSLPECLFICHIWSGVGSDLKKGEKVKILDFLQTLRFGDLTLMLMTNKKQRCDSL